MVWTLLLKYPTHIPLFFLSNGATNFGKKSYPLLLPKQMLQENLCFFNRYWVIWSARRSNFSESFCSTNQHISKTVPLNLNEALIYHSWERSVIHFLLWDMTEAICSLPPPTHFFFLSLADILWPWGDPSQGMVNIWRILGPRYRQNISPDDFTEPLEQPILEVPYF